MGIGFDSPDGFFNGKEETTLNQNCGEITGMTNLIHMILNQECL